MRLEITSFGHKFDPAPNADLVLDARVLPNPWNRTELRDLCGQDAAVALWFQSQDSPGEFIDTAYQLMTTAVRAGNGSTVYRVAIGCTGGHHRSVYVAEQLGALVTLDYSMHKHAATVVHRDLDHPSKTRRAAAKHVHSPSCGGRP